MALYNKDGSVYKLDGPNPIMKTQEFWDEFLTHNMQWNPEVHADSGSKLVIRPPKRDQTTQSESFISELESSKYEYKTELEAQTDPEPEKHVEDKKLDIERAYDESSSITKTFVHCLPAFTMEKKDSLYGDVSVRTHYKNRTSFEAVILKQSDIMIEMWSEVSFQEGSILYPKNGDKRWWKVQSSYPKLGGYVIQGIPSQDQPYFE